MKLIWNGCERNMEIKWKWMKLYVTHSVVNWQKNLIMLTDLHLINILSLLTNLPNASWSKWFAYATHCVCSNVLQNYFLLIPTFSKPEGVCIRFRFPPTPKSSLLKAQFSWHIKNRQNAWPVKPWNFSKS